MKLLLVLILAVVVSAFGLSAWEGGLEGQGGVDEAGCPTATGDTLVLRDQRQGYCLLYPVRINVLHPNEFETILTEGALLTVGNPRVQIRVQGAGGRTAEAIADERVAGTQPGPYFSRASMELGGQPAVVLDYMPGEDPRREVLVVYRGRLYYLVFAPVGEIFGERARRTDALYEMVVDSFRFIP